MKSPASHCKSLYIFSMVKFIELKSYTNISSCSLSRENRVALPIRMSNNCSYDLKFWDRNKNECVEKRPNYKHSKNKNLLNENRL